VEADTNEMLPSTLLLYYSTIELTFQLTSELTFEDVYLCKLTQMKFFYFITAVLTWGDIFESCFKAQSSKFECLFCHVSVK